MLGGDLELTFPSPDGTSTRVLTIPWFIVRKIVLQLEARRQERNRAMLLLPRGLQWRPPVLGVGDIYFLFAHNRCLGQMSPRYRRAILEEEGHNHLDLVIAIQNAGSAGDLDAELLHAIQCGNHAVAALLLDCGADVNYASGEPLRLAARDLSDEMVSLLIDRGANEDPSVLLHFKLALSVKHGYYLSALRYCVELALPVCVPMLLFGLNISCEPVPPSPYHNPFPAIMWLIYVGKQALLSLGYIDSVPPW